MEENLRWSVMWVIEYKSPFKENLWQRPTGQGDHSFRTEEEARVAIVEHIFGRYDWTAGWRIVAPDGAVINY